jgi:hypothetical protein
MAGVQRGARAESIGGASPGATQQGDEANDDVLTTVQPFASAC